MNEAIKLYIEAQFAKLASEPEVERAKRELFQMSEDKYSELIQAGMSEAEATGRVITEFGNLDELADSLGIRSAMAANELAEAAEDLAELEIYTPQQADAAYQSQKRSSIMVALGVGIILLGVLVNVLLRQSTELSFSLSSLSSSFNFNTGFAVLLGIMIAVPIFIMAVGSNKIFRKLEQGEAAVNYDTANIYKTRLDAGEKSYHAGIALGVGLILLGIAVTALIPEAKVGVLVGVLIGVPILIANGGARTGIRILAESGSQTANKRRARAESENTIGTVAAIYWPVVVAIYLLWSFIFDAWHISWITFMVAGILFGVVVVAIESWANKKHGTV